MNINLDEHFLADIVREFATYAKIYDAPIAMMHECPNCGRVLCEASDEDVKQLGKGFASYFMREPETRSRCGLRPRDTKSGPAFDRCTNETADGPDVMGMNTEREEMDKRIYEITNRYGRMCAYDAFNMLSDRQLSSICKHINGAIREALEHHNA